MMQLSKTVTSLLLLFPSKSTMMMLFLLLGCLGMVHGETRSIQTFGSTTSDTGGTTTTTGSSPLIISANGISRPIIDTIRGSGYIQYTDLSFSYLPDTTISNNDDATTSSEKMSGDTTNYLYIDIVISSLEEEKKKKNRDISKGILDNWETTTTSADKEEWLTTNMGIGVKSPSSSDFYVCCTDDALQLGLCEDDKYGRLILSEPHKLKHHTTVKLPRGGSTGSDGDAAAAATMMVEHPNLAMGGIAMFEYSSRVALMIANCNMTATTATSETLQTLTVEGEFVWLSYLAAASVGSALLWTCIHMGLLIWYRYQMILNKTNRIQVESWILYVLLLSSLDALFTLGYQVLEVYFSSTSSNGNIHEFIFWREVSDIITTTARIVSRCLYVIISLGLGVVKTKLSTCTKVCLIGFGGAIWIVQLTADSIGDVSFVQQDEDFFSQQNQVRESMNQMSFYFNMVFMIWIPCALQQTMKSIRRLPDEMGMEQKLQRYRWLWSIYFLSLGCTFLMVLAFFVDMVNTGGKNFDLSSFDDGNQIIYIIVLACMTILWKPNPMAPMYGYVLLQDDYNDNEDLTNVSDIAVEMVESNNSTSIMKQRDSSNNGNDDFDLALQVEDGLGGGEDENGNDKTTALS